MRWHYLTGIVFGILTLTWIFSGLLSVQPFAWMTVRGLQVPSGALSGGPLVLADFSAIDRVAWDRASGGRAAKEVSLLRIGGAPYYDVRLARPPAGPAGHDRLLLEAEALAPQGAPLDLDAVVARLRAALPGVAVTAAAELAAYDAYYYGRGAGAPPLPVVRVQFADPLETWVYVDPAVGRIVATVHRYSRLERHRPLGRRRPDPPRDRPRPVTPAVSACGVQLRQCRRNAAASGFQC